MKIAFDIGGVISKYPEQFHWFMTSLEVNMELYIITDMFFDDFVGYAMAWDSSFGPAPIRLLLCPDPYKPYWSDSWKCEGEDFGRRKFTKI